MKSRKFFNKSLITHAFSQVWAMALIGIFLKLILFVAPFYSTDINIYYYTTFEETIEKQSSFFAFDDSIVFLYVIAMLAIAWIVSLLLFGYLNSSKKSLMMHSFPVSRNQLFGVNYLSGLCALLVPNFIGDLICVPGMLKAVKAGVAESAIMTFAATAVLIALFWSTAVLGIMIAGNAGGAVVTFLMINFAPALLAMGSEFAFSNVLIGYYDTYSPSYAAICPLVSFLFEDNAKLSLIFAIIYFVAFSILAFVAYRVRRLEKSGDAFAFRLVRFVIQYTVVILGSLLFVEFLGLFIESFDNHSALICFLLFIIVSALAFLLTEMFIKKTAKVITKSSFIRFISFAAVIAIAFFSAVTYFENRTLRPESVESATIEFDFPMILENKSDIELACEIQKSALNAAKEERVYSLENQMDFSDWYDYYTPIKLTFNLKNGQKIRREYFIELKSEEFQTERSLENMIESLETHERLENVLFHTDVEKIALNNAARSTIRAYNGDEFEYDEDGNYLDLSQVKLLQPGKDDEFIRNLLNAYLEEIENGGSYDMYKFASSSYYSWWKNQPEKKLYDLQEQNAKEIKEYKFDTFDLVITYKPDNIENISDKFYSVNNDVGIKVINEKDGICTVTFTINATMCKCITMLREYFAAG